MKNSHRSVVSPPGDKVPADSSALREDSSWTLTPGCYRSRPAGLFCCWVVLCLSLSRTFSGHCGREKLRCVWHIKFSKDSPADTNRGGSSRRHVSRCVSSPACRWMCLLLNKTNQPKPAWSGLCSRLIGSDLSNGVNRHTFVSFLFSF